VNRVTLRDLKQLLSNIDAMKAASTAANATTTEAERRAAHLVLCHSIGAVEGMATVVRIDLETYEPKTYVPKKRCSAEPCQKQCEGENWFCSEHLKEEEHV
jgi:hypothetical protein